MDKRSDTQKEALDDLLQAVETADIPIWFYGGYALDALEGNAIREHKDIDIIVEFRDQPRLRDTLARSGFEIAETGTHYTFFVRKSQAIEALTFRRWPDGRCVTDTGETGVYPWPDGSFPIAPNGVLLGRPVRTLSYEGLYVCKAGFSCYDPKQSLREKDIDDLKLICSRIPPERLPELEAFFDAIPGTRQRYPNQDQ